MVLFLTGPRHIGKSTAIERALAETGLRPGGFRTRFDAASGPRRLLLRPADGAPGTVVAVRDGSALRPVPGAFDRAGPAALSVPGEVTLMDELGFLEADEAAFRAAVLSRLDDGNIPVLGAIREGFPGWTAEAARHRSAEIIAVTRQNRAAVPLLIRQRLERLPPLSAVIMASGHGKRFRGDKLSARVEGVPMLERLFMTVPRELFRTVAVVARERALLELAEDYGLLGVFNGDETDDTAVTIRLGLDSAAPGSAGCMFLVGDQPWLSQDTLVDLCRRFYSSPESICLPVCRGRRGNPVIFPKAYFEELKNLPPHGKGRTVIDRHPHAVLERETEAKELRDIDYASDLDPSRSG